MTEPVVDSKIVIQTVPSFLHIALVKVAVPLFYKYGSDMLNTAMTDIQLESLTTCNEGIRENWAVNNSRAREALLYLPKHLRKRVLEAVNGTECEADQWRKDHYYLSNNCLVEHIPSWRSDGTIDRIKTAKELVLNKNIDISMRFKIACKYCFKQSITTLWAEIESSGKAENYAGADNSIENAWIKWIREGTPENWTQALLEQSPPEPWPRYSSFFPSLQSEDREKALAFIQRFDLDDMRFCLYAMTNEEELEIVKMGVRKFLMIFVKWPLQNLFLEMAEKVKNYIDYDSFFDILYLILYRRFCADFDYRKLLEGFWKMSPENFKERMKESSLCLKTIETCLKEKRIPQQIVYVGPRKRLLIG